MKQWVVQEYEWKLVENHNEKLTTKSKENIA